MCAKPMCSSNISVLFCHRVCWMVRNIRGSRPAQQQWWREKVAQPPPAARPFEPLSDLQGPCWLPWPSVTSPSHLLCFRAKDFWETSSSSKLPRYPCLTCYDYYSSCLPRKLCLIYIISEIFLMKNESFRLPTSIIYCYLPLSFQLNVGEFLSVCAKHSKSNRKS